jgi:hypothetical protein
MNAYGGVDVLIGVFLTSVLVGGVISITLLTLYPRERAPSTHWIGGRVGPRTVLDDVQKRIFLILTGPELRFITLKR